jgi:hypothetical protein
MTELRERAAATLPPALRPLFEQLVADYQVAARAHVAGRQPWINYKILADLLRSGWRKEHSASDSRLGAHGRSAQSGPALSA